MARSPRVIHRIFRYLIFSCLLLTCSHVWAQEEKIDVEVTPPATTESKPAEATVRELHRIRIVNRKDGAIQVSTDKGVTWQLVGRVLAPATSVGPGYLASQYAQPGVVAATAVHGLRIRTGKDDPNGRPPLVLAIEPVEYASRAGVGGAKPNSGYGGYVSGAGGIFTDIRAGTSIFRELAPLVGNPVYLESTSGRIFPLPQDFYPAGLGEAIVIIVNAPTNSLTSIVFENRVGGKVEVTFADGTTKQVTNIVRPVKGVGRFDGTAFTGVGRINTAHTGVITVSTAPIDRSRAEGVGKEQRGGFQICPEWHNSHNDEWGAPQILTLGPPGARRRELEGMPPLFRDMIGLDSDGAQVEISVDDGPWEALPTILGNRPNAFTGEGLTTIWKEQGKNRTAKIGATAFRLNLPKQEPARITTAIAQAVETYRKYRYDAARAGRIPMVSGTLTINANPTNAANVSFVRFSVEGTPRGFTNVSPFTLTWDTTRVPDGEYLVEAEALDEAGHTIATTRRRVYVHNPAETQAAAR